MENSTYTKPTHPTLETLLKSSPEVLLAAKGRKRRNAEAKRIIRRLSEPDKEKLWGSSPEWRKWIDQVEGVDHSHEVSLLNEQIDHLRRRHQARRQNRRIAADAKIVYDLFRIEWSHFDASNTPHDDIVFAIETALEKPEFTTWPGRRVALAVLNGKQDDPTGLAVQGGFDLFEYDEDEDITCVTNHQLAEALLSQRAAAIRPSDYDPDLEWINQVDHGFFVDFENVRLAGTAALEFTPDNWNESEEVTVKAEASGGGYGDGQHPPKHRSSIIAALAALAIAAGIPFATADSSRAVSVERQISEFCTGDDQSEFRRFRCRQLDARLAFEIEGGHAPKAGKPRRAKKRGFSAGRFLGCSLLSGLIYSQIKPDSYRVPRPEYLPESETRRVRVAPFSETTDLGNGTYTVRTVYNYANRTYDLPENVELNNGIRTAYNLAKSAAKSGYEKDRNEAIVLSGLVGGICGLAASR